MKRTFLSYTLTLAMMFMGLGMSFAQPAEEAAAEETTEAVADSNAQEEAPAEEPVVEAATMEAEDASTDGEEDAAEEAGLHQAIKQKFIDGGPFFMAIVLICLILGLALSIERILYLNMASTNTGKLLEEVESALQSGGVEAAKEVCRNTRGPVASIFFQGLERADHGIEMVEKSVVSYGSVQMGLLEKGLSWISLFIALAPMLGFFGTVIGMIGAFDAIAAANNISPGIVASGIGVALITTVSGLLVAMVLQVFYNYIVAKVDSIVNEMENASISLIDIMIKHQMTK
ncbi:MotA/TolQ/ExbB proton channel family protein [bacterium]|nr:MotA/TolQ/ExbB proton channel family protein [bacterium]